MTTSVPDARAAPARAPGIAWSWQGALLGALCVLPAAAVAATDPQRGLALAVGVLPAAIVGVPPQRRRRVGLVVVGALTGIGIFVGSALAGVPVVAVAAIFLFGVGAALLAARWPLGRIVMVLSLPLVGVGLSYDDIGKGAGLALLMVAGSAYAWLVSLAWPERKPPAREASPPSTGPTLDYGLRLGAAGATAAAIGFALDLEHVGWACAAALLVMRPAAEMQILRSIGRIASVIVGGAAATALIALSPQEPWYALAAAVPIIAAAATRASRWYVTPAFTTFIVILLLLYSDPGDSAVRFTERVVETLLGVGLAFIFGLLIPKLRASGAHDVPQT